MDNSSYCSIDPDVSPSVYIYSSIKYHQFHLQLANHLEVAEQCNKRMRDGRDGRGESECVCDSGRKEEENRM